MDFKLLNFTLSFEKFSALVFLETSWCIQARVYNMLMNDISSAPLPPPLHPPPAQGCLQRRGPTGLLDLETGSLFRFLAKITAWVLNFSSLTPLPPPAPQKTPKTLYPGFMPKKYKPIPHTSRHTQHESQHMQHVLRLMLTMGHNTCCMITYS